MPLTTDFDLAPAHIQSLSSREAVAALLTMLGYHTDARLTQTAEAMGFPEALKRETQHVERLAEEEGGVLQVYLAELKSVTVANVQLLARALRNRGGNFLWVLTSDYERLDFVLMEPTLPAAPTDGNISLKGAFLRPRTLTVNRRNPAVVEVRVLRRFSYTEADADYQFQKLQSAYTIAEWSEPFFNNRALFSDYYLKERLPQSSEWGESAEAAGALQTFQGLLADVRGKVTGKPEKVAREQLLEPALKALGFSVKDGGRKTMGDVTRPDYLLYAGEGGGPAAFCNAYVWDRFLDGRDEQRDAETPDENPGALVVSLLERDDAPDWAIVTNGKTWRLYSKRAHSRATNYYEIDLEETVASPDPGFAFRYFWLIFRAAAFTPTPHPPPSGTAPMGEGAGGGSFLDRLLTDSALYAKELGERLKDRVFEEIFPQFAEGFITHLRANVETRPDLSDERLAEVFHGTLTFLYRLLFLLYAEARDLLPVREQRGYHEISLTKLRQEIAGRASTIVDEAPDKIAQAYSPTSAALYDRLTRLFAVVDAGEPTLNVPTYNGGLFITQPGADDATPEAEAARFLTAHKIPDRFLALGLDLLSRDLDDKSQALTFIDYKSLGVRQLGSIYEGLLEFKLRVAPEKMAVVKGKKSEEVIPFKEAEAQGLKVRATLPKGQVYLENDKRERKATGSYYTPDYIVKYIVQNTVGPALAARCEALRPQLREAGQKHREAVKRKQSFERQNMKGDDPEKVAHTYRHVTEDLFDLRVLDPAMGSGHFLVEAVDFITDHLLDFLNAFPWNPVLAELRRTRATILEEMERQKVIIDPARLTDVNLLKRHVLKRCIFGVDLNPMAVELAKVSLWLDCFTLGAPLSFLDHHLKPGNSLIGARVTEVREAVEFKAGEQYGFFTTSQFTGLMLATDLMRQIGALEDVTAAQVRESRTAFRQAMDALAPFKRVLDVWVSQWFGNTASKQQAKLGLNPVVDFLRREAVRPWLDDPQQGAKKLPADLRPLAAAALRAASEKQFFHWELEFPEVFFGPTKASAQQIEMKENPGFDAVVGNPPYLNAWTMTEEMPGERQAINSLFDHAQLLEGHWDLYIPFILNSILLSNLTAFHSFIVPNPFLREKYAVALRESILSTYHLQSILSFGETNVFDEVSRQCIVYVIAKNAPQKKSQSIRVAVDANPFAYKQSGEVENDIWLKAYNYQIRVDEAYIHGIPLLEKIQNISDLLGQYLYVNVGATVSSKVPGAFAKKDVVGYSPQGNAKRFFDGADVNRYSIDWQQVWLDYKRTEMSGPRSPEMFDSAKVLIRIRTGENETLIASYDDTQMYCDHTVIVCCPYKSLEGSTAQSDFEGFERKDTPIDLKFVLSLINSGLLSWVFQNKFATGALQGSYSDVWPQSVRSFPVRRIAFTTPEKRRAALVRETQDLSGLKDLTGLGYAEYLASPLGRWVMERLATQPEEADVIHDLLAHLAGQMIEMNKQKQAEVKRFSGWLESALTPNPPSGRPVRKKREQERGAGGLIESLTGKSRLKNYLGDYQKGEGELPFAELEDILYKNRNKIGVSLSDVRFTAKLRGEFEKSLAVLLPLKERLARTDRLIDLVVYALYGLTEEEVAVVEGGK